MEAEGRVWETPDPEAKGRAARVVDELLSDAAELGQERCHGDMATLVDDIPAVHRECE